MKSEDAGHNYHFLETANTAFLLAHHTSRHIPLLHPQNSPAMSRGAKLTLIVSSVFCVGTIYGVHWLQYKEREVRVSEVLSAETVADSELVVNV